MIAISTLLQHLGRPEVTEITLRSGEPPTVIAGGASQHLGSEALSGDDLLQILFAAGGSRYVDSLGPRPASWRTRVEGVALSVSASMNGDVVEARLALRDSPAAMLGDAPKAPAVPAPPPPPPPKARVPSVAPPRPQASKPSVPPAAPKGGPKSNRTRSDSSPGSKRPRRSARPPAGDTPKPAPVDAAFRSRVPQEPPPLLAELDDPGPRHTMPTPPREFSVPREAMPSQLDLEVEIPSIPRPVTVPAAVSPAPPPVAVDETPSGPPTPLSAPTLPGARASAEKAKRSPGRAARPFAREAHATLFRRILRTARELNASDLHLVAGRPSLVRTVGQIQPIGGGLDTQVLEDMLLFRLPRRLEETFERDGSCDFSLEEPELGRFRVNLTRHRGGMKASLRLIPLYIPTLATLGLPDAIAAATRHHQGLIVLTGPTGHGKTTTLAALVDILNSETSRHVITVEDPIEYIHPRKRALLSQREVGAHTRSFGSALKAALREDPDVIVVGELRDTETVRIALEASETGHLVLGTMSTPSAAKTIERLIDLFPPGDQQQVRMTLAGGLRLIVGQRLLPDAEGRSMIAAAEVLPGILPLWNLIRDNRTYQIPSLQQRGRELGVIRLDDSLRDLVRAGRISAPAAVAVAENADEMEQTLGIRRPSVQSMAAVQAPGQGAPNPRGTSPVRPDVKPPEPSRGIFDRVFKKGG